MSEDEPIECAIVTVRLIERVIGMLMHLWSLVPDAETKQAIRETIDDLNKAEE